MLLAWAAEAAQLLISQGLTLAILAWRQTLPEFAAQGVNRLGSGKRSGKIQLTTAKFTGSLRLLLSRPGQSSRPLHSVLASGTIARFILST